MKNLLLFFVLGLMSYSTSVLAAENEDDQEAPIVTNRDQSQGPVSTAPHDAPHDSNAVVNLDGSESIPEVAPVSFDLSNLKPNDSLSPETAQKVQTQLNGLKLPDFNALPPKFRSFVIQRADSAEDKRFLESIRRDEDDDGPRFGPKLNIKESKPFEDLVDAYRNRPLKFKIKRIKAVRDITGQKIKGTSGWGFEISVPLGK